MVEMVRGESWWLLFRVVPSRSRATYRYFFPSVEGEGAGDEKVDEVGRSLREGLNFLKNTKRKDQDRMEERKRVWADASREEGKEAKSIRPNSCLPVQLCAG
jgi:hypothetical protein